MFNNLRRTILQVLVVLCVACYAHSKSIPTHATHEVHKLPGDRGFDTANDGGIGHCLKMRVNDFMLRGNHRPR
jgi:hypothetical protein